MRKLLVSTVYFLFTFCAMNAQLTQQSIASSNSAGGRTYFYQYLPPHFSTAPAKLPLIISLHGGGEAGPADGSNLVNVLGYGLPNLVNQGNVLEFTWQGVTEGFVMLAPQTTAGGVADWPTYYVDEMINYALANLNVDKNRIFLTGYSYGGNGVWKYASYSAANAQKLAGITPAASTAADPATNFCNIGANKVPVWAVHGSADPITDQNTINNTNATNNPACPASPGFPASPVVPAVDTIYQGQQHGVYMVTTYDFTNTSHYPNMFQWMLKINRNLDPLTNLPPVPMINGATSTTLNLTAPVKVKNIKLDGTKSYDQDDIIMDYLWEATTTPAGSNVTVGNTMWPVATVGATTSGGFPSIKMSIGNYLFRLRVKDYLTSAVYGANNHTQFANLNINISYADGLHSAPVTEAGGTVTIPSTATTYPVDVNTSHNGIQGQAEFYPCSGCQLGAPYYNWVQIQGPVTAQLRNYQGTANYAGQDNNVSFAGLTAAGTYKFVFYAYAAFGGPSSVGSDTLTIIKPSGALPVEYAYFNGQNTGNVNVLSWATTTEINSARFDIMSSTDGINFNIIGSLASKGGTTGLTEYTFTDNSPAAGLNYYRLSQVDKDGQASLSKTITVSTKKTGLYIEKYPNPAHDNLTVTIQGTTNGSTQVMIADMQGKTILQQQWQKDQSLLKKVINISSLQKGIYQMVVIVGQEKQVSSFVKY